MTSQSVNDYIWQLAGSGSRSIWVGGSDNITEGIWYWYDGSEWNFENWDIDTPDNLYKSSKIPSEDCLELTQTGKWNDYACAYSKYYVCAIKECSGKPDQFTCCTPSSPCPDMGGDCDTHADCQGTLECGTDNCKDVFPFADVGADCCEEPGCRGYVGQGSCCTSGSPCEEGGGDCDSDKECAGDLVCGSNNCLTYAPPSPLNIDKSMDCCEKPLLG